MSRDPAAARAFHEATKHTYESVRRLGLGLDWANRPHPFKEYAGLEPEPLPPELDRLLRLGAGVVRTRSYAGGVTYHFRTYASAGALYPVEVYAARPEGLFHFHPRELAVRRLLPSDLRGYLADAAADRTLADAAAVLVLTGLLWRTAWKYGARGYRHLFWDAGTMLANLLALADQPRLVTGFVDARVSKAVAEEREAPLALLAVGRGPHARAHGDVLRIELPSSEPVREVSYPEVTMLQEGSSLATREDVMRYRGGWAPTSEPDPLAAEDLDRVLLERGSVRQFAPEPLPCGELGGLLTAALGPILADVPPATEVFVIAHAVEGLAPGVYRFEPPGSWELLRGGDFRRQAAYLCLEQPLGALAAAVVFLMVDLDGVLERRGDRGYRWAQLEGGIRTGRLYVGGFARRWGATGTTFYDDDVTQLVAPGTTLAPMLAVALGRRR